MTRGREIAAAALAVALLVACSTRRNAASTGSEPAPHAVFNEQMRELMGNLNSLTISEKEMTEIERDVRRARNREELSATAEAIGSTVDAIIAASPNLKLDARDQSAFLHFAGQLRREAGTLKIMADQGYNEALPGQLERIQKICQACHRLFRTDGF